MKVWKLDRGRKRRSANNQDENKPVKETTNLKIVTTSSLVGAPTVKIVVLSIECFIVRVITAGT